MHPTLGHVSIGPRELVLSSYAVALVIAWLVAFGGSLFACARAGFDVGRVVALGGLVTASAFVGGHVTFVVVELCRGVPLASAIREGGRVLFGAYLGGGAGLALFARWLGLPMASIADRAVPSIALAHAIGRIGCLLAGCCYGSAATLPWAIVATDPMAPAADVVVARHPVAAYEAIAMAILAGGLARRSAATPGARTETYLVAMLSVRFVLEFFRGDAARGVVLGLGTSQLLAIVVLALFAMTALGRRVRTHALS